MGLAIHPFGSCSSESSALWLELPPTLSSSPSGSPPVAEMPCGGVGAFLAEVQGKDASKTPPPAEARGRVLLLLLLVQAMMQSVTEPPKVLGPPTVVIVLRTLDNLVDAPNHSTSSVNLERVLLLLQYQGIKSAQSIIIDQGGKTSSRTKVHCFQSGRPTSSTTIFTARTLPWVPPLNKNIKTLLFSLLQQHGFENPKYGVYFCKSYPTKEKTLKDMLV
jgi:hypothetical protein